MLRIIAASLYKLFRERTFIVTLIIGAVLSILLPLLYKWIGGVTGSYALLSSSSPGSNFGLTVPINAVVMTVGEFTCGAIRNKVIAGHKKSSIYFALLVSGVIFTLILMAFYIGASTLVGTLLGGGFNASGNLLSARFVWTFIFSSITTYIFVASLSIFVATLFRQIGGSMPILIILLVMLSLLPTFMSIKNLGGQSNFDFMYWVDPIFFLSKSSSLAGQLIDSLTGSVDLTNTQIAGAILSPLFYATAITFAGIQIFKHRDIK